VDFLPDDDGGDEDGVFADSMDYQEFDDIGQDSLTRPFYVAHYDDAMKTNSYSISPVSNTIPFFESSELKAQLRHQQRHIQEMMSVESYPDPHNPDVAERFEEWIGKTVDDVPPDKRDYHLHDRFGYGFKDTDAFRSFKQTAKNSG
jgi:hypothetical protein